MANGGFFVEGSNYTIVLYSECVDGRRAYVRVGATAFGAGLSWPFGEMSGSEIVLNDPFDEIYVSELAGPFAHFSMGATIGGGVSSGSMTVGSAQGEWSTSAVGGTPSIDYGTLVLGRSWMLICIEN